MVAAPDWIAGSAWRSRQMAESHRASVMDSNPDGPCALRANAGSMGVWRSIDSGPAADPAARASGRRASTASRWRPVAVGRRRRARRRVARRLAVLQPQPGGVAPAGAAVPASSTWRRSRCWRRWSGPAIDRFRLGHRWIAVDPVRAPRACAPPRWRSRCSTSALYFFALALLIGGQGVRRRRARRSCPGSSTSPTSSSPPTPGWPASTSSPAPSAAAVGGGVLAVTIARGHARAWPASRSRCGRVVHARLPAAHHAAARSPRRASSTRSCTRRRSSPRRGRSRSSVRRSGSSSSASPSPCAARASRRGCTARRSPRTAPARSPATPSRPLLRRRFGEDRLTAGALVVAGGRRSRSARSGRRGCSCCSCRSCSAASPRSPARAFDAMVQTHAPTATRGRSFARFETRFQLGWVLGARRRDGDRDPDPATAWPSLAVGSAAGRRGCTSTRCARLSEAHAEDPFDPVEVARRRIDHAVEWHRRDLDRLAVTELAGVVDLARATGVALDAETVVRLDALRAAALSTWPLDSREVEWAMTHAASRSSIASSTQRHAASTRPSARAAGRRPRRRAVRTRSTGSTDDDVTVHCDERRANVRTTLRPVVLRAVDLDRDVDRVAVRRQLADRDEHAVRRGPARCASSSSIASSRSSAKRTSASSSSSPATSAWTSAAIVVSPTPTTNTTGSASVRPAAAGRRGRRGSRRRRPAASRDTVRRRPTRRSHAPTDAASGRPRGPSPQRPCDLTVGQATATSPGQPPGRCRCGGSRPAGR